MSPGPKDVELNIIQNSKRPTCERPPGQMSVTWLRNSQSLTLHILRMAASWFFGDLSTRKQTKLEWTSWEERWNWREVSSAGYFTGLRCNNRRRKGCPVSSVHSICIPLLIYVFCGQEIKKGIKRIVNKFPRESVCSITYPRCVLTWSALSFEVQICWIRAIGAAIIKDLTNSVDCWSSVLVFRRFDVL